MSVEPVVVEALCKDIAAGFLGRRKRILHDVSFRIGTGAVVGFVGANGAGKSTTIRHLLGLNIPTSGKVRIQGRAPTDPAARFDLGVVPEVPGLPPRLTPREIMRLHMALTGTRREEGQDLLESVGLNDAQDRVVGRFSKGMRQRLALALALLAKPKLLILDEPMSGLDPAGRDLVRRLLREQAGRGTTILFSSHVLSDVETLCTDVLLIAEGRLRYSGPVHAPPSQDEASHELVVRVESDDVSWPAEVESHHQTGGLYRLVTRPGSDPYALAAKLEARGMRVMSVMLRTVPLEQRLLSILEQT